ncbi:MAG TPA: sigma-54 dependent transcriptional regulator [Spirochaetota bacterium]|jgi:transcriptional regulator with PAS, ATPase and Fis domain|nr:sigma-54 dependent transcriptional regulator [Spirochaetota bacterium]HPY87950.1 sigma-54 dependent transcriptional regulator [Spirochaetota bacterium]HQB60128.1 sigma-54 dependent transcriptional regulator [Spirochaetota bacterium]
MINILLSWIGTHDLDSIQNNAPMGPVISLVNSKYSKDFDEIHLISNYDKETNEKYINVVNLTEKITLHKTELADPSDYKSIYEVVTKIITEITNSKGKPICWHYHTSPGTPQMSSIWILLGKTKYPGIFYQSWLDKKTNEIRVKIADIPFNINIDFIPELFVKQDKEIVKNWENLPAFNTIIHKSKIMKDLLDKTYLASIRDVPILILGETGTGKELFAKAIHQSSKRNNSLMKTINCGALPESIIDATLFGYSKGAFTGAVADKKGIFEECDNGTIFLDEIGDLSLNIQVKLLRAIQQGEIQRVGDMKESKVNVRIIGATNKNLIKMVEEGTFREDLFYRISVGVLNIPPLRERREDIILLSEYFLSEINEEFGAIKSDIPYQIKSFSNDCKEYLLNRSWNGNVRELYFTIKRACIWNNSSIIDDNDVKDSVISQNKYNSINLTDPINLEKYLEEIKIKYIAKALEITEGNKTKAAKMLGYNNYQNIDYVKKKKIK